ncbi:hypothetical protein K437DRAFT_47636 [Tilletiaria anomala UBC 951]|uniref:ER transporter 6TM N-terminal domain-containing protein n=1 Tax=Tilletiaria anomala (strain ATCC 24038 / CBS 436.72 / UBC 951) TaxID=1037660 RepID=A0A066VDU3_TILAU|nr:uncharacterized protein K437DRAFT_47636 [Tilletiaria anomala UBC 951]KDN36919.1 hypothetical protein K437DRAFT_47636 [Tilletiaria anomala UBC 951]
MLLQPSASAIEPSRSTDATAANGGACTASHEGQALNRNEAAQDDTSGAYLKVGKEEADASVPKVRGSNSKLPEWITKNVKDPHSWKMLARCWLASWVTLILMLPTRSLQTFGQAAFFASMITFMIPSNMPVSIWLIANATLVIGCLLGWAWGAAAMAAGLFSRDSVLLASQLRTAQASVAAETNPEAAFKLRIFQGDFLDIRASAVIGAFFVVGAYALGIMMAKVPKLQLSCIFALIVMDIMCSYGPLFPFAQYTLATIFMLPIGASLGVAFGCMLFVFPESLNYSWTRNLVSMLELQRALLAMHSAFISDPATHNTPALEEFDRKLKGTSNGLIGLSDALSGEVAFLELDVSRGRFSGKDLRKLLLGFRTLNVRLFGMAAFPHLLQNFADGGYVEQNVMGDQGAPQEEPGAGDAAAGKEGNESWKDLKHPVQIHDSTLVLRARQRIQEAEAEQHVKLSTLQPLMAKAAGPTLEACGEALGAITAFIDRTNRSRWRLRKRDDALEAQTLQRIQDAAANLARVHQAFVDEERLALFRPYEHHFKVERDGSLHLDEQSAIEFRTGGRPLFLCLVWVVSLSRFSKQLVKVSDEIHELASKRQSNRLWLPSSLRSVWKVLTSKKATAGGPFKFFANTGLSQEDTAAGDGDDDDDEDLQHSTASSTVALEKDAERDASGKKDIKASKADGKGTRRRRQRHRRRAVRRDPDAMPPTNALHYLGRSITGIYNVMTSTDGIFALRVAVVTLALWVPQVVPSSAAFYYHQRGVWALIMAQLGLTVFTGAQVFASIARIAGTIVGGLIGTAMWYISAGSGSGNVYAYAVVGGVAFVPLVFLRLYVPPAMLVPALMVGVTALLVFGYSWIDTHLFVTANSGVGIEVFWRRTLLVVIGIAGSFAVLLIGRPASSRGLVRQSVAGVTQDILDIYSTIIEAYIKIDSQVDSAAEKPAQIIDEQYLVDHLRPLLLDTFARLAELNTHVGLASVDVAPRGHWPKERYVEAVKAQARMLEALSHLAGAAFGISTPSEWQRHFLRSSALLDPSIIADISMHLSLISRALATGTPLPHTSAGNLLDRTISVQIEARKREKVLGQDSVVSSLSLHALHEPAFMDIVTGIVALGQFVRSCDQLAAITAALVGEVPLEGYDALLSRVEDQMWNISQRS